MVSHPFVALRDADVSRRDVLRALGTATGGFATGRGVDNVLLGYGLVSGTNLRGQDVAALVRERLAVRALRESLAERRSLTADDVRIAPTAMSAFFDRLATSPTRPDAVSALRGDRFRDVDADTVERFARRDPASTAALTRGLAAGFRRTTSYDYARYAAGAVENNVLANAVDLRAPLRSPVGFEALLSDRDTGLFCYEFAHRAVEAFHAVPAAGQSAPVAAGVVVDERHKHVYTVLASVVVDDGVTIPVTFVDYTHATVYDDLFLRGILGEGINAYDGRHRATDVFWNRYAVV